MTEVVIVRAVQTCDAFPSQWDAWDLDGNYWYLRYRHGRGTAERQPGPDTVTWNWPSKVSVGFYGGDDDADGEISLERFCELTPILKLALDRPGFACGNARIDELLADPDLADDVAAAHESAK